MQGCGTCGTDFCAHVCGRVVLKNHVLAYINTSTSAILSFFGAHLLVADFDIQWCVHCICKQRVQAWRALIGSCSCCGSGQKM